MTYYKGYSNDPRWIKAKFAGTDIKGNRFKAGEEVFYYPATKTIYSGEAAKEAAADFDARVFDDNNCSW